MQKIFSEIFALITKKNKLKTSFDQIYIGLAAKIANQSHCVRQKVGAVIAKDTRIISVGYNGPPSKTYNCDEEWPNDGCKSKLGGGCFLAMHAEQNAILYALKNSNANLEGSSIYCTLSPCLPCAKMIFSVGIKNFFYLDSYAKYKGGNYEEGLSFLEEFGIVITKLSL